MGLTGKMFASLFIGVAAVFAQDDPNLLSIGRAGSLKVQAGKVYETASGKTVDYKRIANLASKVKWVFVGESHDNPWHHEAQAKVIDALVASKRNVVVGFEMFTRPIQPKLLDFSLGWQTDEEFIRESDWKTQWGFDYKLYKPIFDVIRANRLPMVALNVPRDWVRRVGKDGYSALSADERAQVTPDLDLNNTDHRNIFTALMGGHPMTGTRGENIYSAQVLWDTGMADSAIKAMAQRKFDENPVMVIIAGIGHVMYGQGINYRLAKRTGDATLNVVCVEASPSAQVAKGLGDVIIATESPERK